MHHIYQREFTRNLTGSVAGNTSCACGSDFVGGNCNICLSDVSCGGGGSLSSILSIGGGGGGGFGEELACNRNAQPIGKGGFATCQMPPGSSLENFFSGPFHFDFTRNTQEKTLQTYGYYYDGEQFSCLSSGCVEKVDRKNLDNSLMTCPETRCSSVPNTVFDRAGFGQALTFVTGGLTLACNSKNINASTCVFDFPALRYVIDSTDTTQWKLTDCTYGECVLLTDLQGDIVSVLTPPIMAVLVIICLLVGVIILVCIYGKITQRRLRRQRVPPPKPGAFVEWRNIDYIVKIGVRKSQPKKILHSVCGAAYPGEVLAVMGPSGAGKSTLVDIVAGRTKRGKLSGSVMFNGVRMSEIDLRTIVGFVGQEDTLPRHQTVKECCEFAMTLKLPEGLSRARKMQRVEETLKILGLSHVANTRVGDTENRGLSGGEKRRLSIALQLLTSPELLVLDEPLTGLDSKSAKDVCDALNGLARSPLKTTVVLTVHQPRSDIFHAFDKVALVAHGRIIYHGLPDDASNYFSGFGHTCPALYNPADFLLDVAHVVKSGGGEVFPAVDITETNGGYMRNRKGSQDDEYDEKGMYRVDTARSYKSEADSVRYQKKRSEGKYKASFITQLEMLCKREAKAIVREWHLLAFHIGITCGGGFFQGVISFGSKNDIAGIQNRLGAVFFFLIISAFASISAIAPFYRSKGVFLRERADNYYHPFAWALTRATFDILPLRFLPITVATTFVYWMVGLTPDFGRYVKFWFLQSFYYMSMALFFMTNAAWFTDEGVATLVSSLESLNQLLWAGFFMNLDHTPALFQWIKWLVQSKYALEALCINEVEGNVLNASVYGFTVQIKEPYIVSKLFGFHLDQFWTDLVVVTIFVGFFFCTYSFVVLAFLKEKR